MTWVIGACTLGHAVVFGDIRVSYSLPGRPLVEELAFGVQKVHPITPTLAVGFSGVVEVELRLVADFQTYVREPGVRAIDEPADVAASWVERLRRGRYSRIVTSRFRHYATDLIFAGVSQRRGRDERGREFWHIPYGGTCRFMGSVGQLVPVVGISPWSIGSGGDVAAYKEATDEVLPALLLRTVNMGVGRERVVHVLLGGVVSRAVRMSPTAGIAAHLVGAVVTAEGTLLGTSDPNFADPAFPEGRAASLEPMPPLARSLQEFRLLAGRFPAQRLAATGGGVISG